ncbi:MAG: translocation/assembly module TamB domain-containing protein, partial [Gammaproteobacteria bacterium]|nr:translocation/assembly module TamB domain-containing protein [Gammaproteobacteria bacterium]
SWRERRVELRTLEVSARRDELAASLQASGRLGTALDADQRLDVDWRIELPDEDPALRGSTRLRGPIAAMRIDQSLSGLIDARLNGTLRDVLEAPAWDFQLALSPLPDGVSLWPEQLIGTAARLTLRGDIAGSRIDGEVDLPGWLDDPLGVELTGGWREGIARLESGRLTLADGGELRIGGSVAPEDGLAATLEIEAHALGWPMGEADPEFSLATLRLTVEGREERYDFALQASGGAAVLPEVTLAANGQLIGRELHLQSLQVDDADGQLGASGEARVALDEADVPYDFDLTGFARIPGEPEITLDVAGAGDVRQVAFSRLRIGALEGTAQGAGRLAWSEGAVMDFSLEVRDINPGSHYPGWQGRLSASLALTGEFGEAPDVELNLTPIRGTLRNRAVDGDIRVALAGDTLTLRSVELAVGGARASASGTLGDRLDLAFSLLAPNLNDLYPGAGGQLDARGRLTGLRDAPALVLDVQASELRYASWALTSLSAALDLDLSEAAVSTVDLQLDGLRGEDTLVNTLALQGEGTTLAHRVTLNAARGEASLDLEVTGGLDEDAQGWSGLLDTVSLVLAEDIVWALQRPSEITVGRASARLDNVCMDGSLGLVCIRGDWRGGATWGGELGVAQLDLEGLTRWLTDGLVARGTVAGTIIVDADERGFVQLGGGLGLTAGSLFLSEQPEDVLLAWRGAGVSLDGDEAAARGTLTVDLADEDDVRGGFEIGWNDPDLPLSASLDVRLGQLGLIAELLPDLAGLSGDLGANFEVLGSVREPQVSGRIFWENGAAQVPVIGIAPRDISATIDLDPDTLSYQLSATSGDGVLTSSGRFTFADGFAGNANLSGSNLLVLDLPEARVLASPEIGMIYRGNHLQVNGVVAIPNARVTGIVQGGGTVSESPDTVMVGADVSDDQQLEIGYVVRLNVGPEVSIDAAGLRGRIEGSLLAIQGSDGIPTGRGDVRVIDGSFGAFGQRLTIEQGRLLFTGGPIDDPGLDIRAVRRIDDITAGAQVRGTLSEPEISVFSEPPMPRAEALSYLTLGKSINDLDSGEQASLDSAA